MICYEFNMFGKFQLGIKNQNVQLITLPIRLDLRNDLLGSESKLSKL